MEIFKKGMFQKLKEVFLKTKCQYSTIPHMSLESIIYLSSLEMSHMSCPIAGPFQNYVGVNLKAHNIFTEIFILMATYIC